MSELTQERIAEIRARVSRTQSGITSGGYVLLEDFSFDEMAIVLAMLDAANARIAELEADTVLRRGRMRKPSKRQARYLGFLAGGSIMESMGPALQDSGGYLSGWSFADEETYYFYEDADGRTCRSLIARGWVEELERPDHYIETWRGWRISAAGRVAAEKYLDLEDWVDMDEWEKAKGETR